VQAQGAVWCVQAQGAVWCVQAQGAVWCVQAQGERAQLSTARHPESARAPPCAKSARDSESVRVVRTSGLPWADPEGCECTRVRFEEKQGVYSARSILLHRIGEERIVPRRGHGTSRDAKCSHQVPLDRHLCVNELSPMGNLKH
jgi:hypothetical protein